MAAPLNNKDIPKLSFEDALSELERIVQQLEDGDVPLEESIVIYERGDLLRRHCEGKLQEAELKVEKIVVGPDGSAKGVAPAES